MCHFSVQQRHPLSLLTTSIFIAETVIAQRHGLNLALLIRFNAAPYKGDREWEVSPQSRPTELARVNFRGLLKGHRSRSQ